MRKIIRFFISIYFWILLIGLGFLVCLIGIISNFISKHIHKIDNLDVKIHSIACLWGKLVFKLMPQWKISIEGSKNLPEDDEKVVYISNHESLADIIALFNLDVPFRWMAKEELFRVPFLGRLMYVAGYIPVRRGSKEKVKEALDKSRATLDRGVSMMIFPEGTRSKTHKLSAFKNGAFILATEKKKDIVPIILSGTCDLVPKGSFLVGKVDVKIKVLERIRYDSSRSVEELKAKSFEIMSQYI